MFRTRTAAVMVPAMMTAMLAGTLAACGDDAGDGKVTISFWSHTHPPMIELNKTLIAEYTKQNPNVRVDYQTIPNNEFNTKMLTSLSTGSGPDVINMDDSALRGEYIPKRLLAKIDPTAFGVASLDELTGRYNPGTLDGAKGPDGALYGVPSEFNGTAFVINTKHFTDAGLDPAKPPTTWDEVATQGRTLVAAGHPQAFSFLYLHSGWYSQQLQTLLNQTGGQLADGKQARVDSPDSVAALKIWTDLARGPGKVADPNATSREATQPFQDLASGKQSMAIVYPWSMELVRQTNPDTYKQLKVVPLPQVAGKQATNRWYGYYWSVNNASKQQKEAWKFIAFLAGNSARWLADVDFVQPLKGWTDTPAAKEIPALDVWAKSYEAGRFDEVTPHYAEVQDALTTMVNDAVFNGVPPQEAARKAAETINRILRD